MHNVLDHGICGGKVLSKGVTRLVVNLLLRNGARALAHLLFHLVCGGLIPLLQLLLLLPILQAVIHSCV